MIILGIDPGLAITGYGIIQVENLKFKAKSYGCIYTDSKLLTIKRLEKIHLELKKL